MINFRRIYSAMSKLHAGQMTWRDLFHKVFFVATDNKRRRRDAVRLSAEFLGISVDQALNIIAAGKGAYYQEWGCRVMEKGYNDITQAQLYKEFNFYIVALPYGLRNQSWYYIEGRLPKGGTLLEYGCGSAVLTEWVLQKRPDVQCTVVDVPGRTLEFVKWKLKEKVRYAATTSGAVAFLDEMFDVITCCDVLEHTPNPLEIARFLTAHLKIGGYLFIDFISFDLKESIGNNLLTSQQQRRSTIEYLNTHLTPVRSIPFEGTYDYWGIYRKPACGA